tara:strand:+ start:98 stop:556 length:459 start_codon:yes stop_codon:yes gene_type:complete
MAELSGTKIASFRGDIEDLRNGTIDRSVFNAARDKIVEEIGESATKQLERRLRTELSQGGDDIGDSRPDKRKFSPGMESKLSKSVTLDKNKGGMAKKKGPMQMAMGGMANGKKHMYLSNGGSVMDKLPNPGLKALAKTKKGKAAVRKMGFDV